MWIINHSVVHSLLFIHAYYFKWQFLRQVARWIMRHIKMHYLVFRKIQILKFEVDLVIWRCVRCVTPHVWNAQPLRTNHRTYHQFFSTVYFNLEQQLHWSIRLSIFDCFISLQQVICGEINWTLLVWIDRMSKKDNN